MEFLVQTAIGDAQTLHTMPMSATSNFNKCSRSILIGVGRWLPFLVFILVCLEPIHAFARDKSEAEAAALALAKDQEKEGFEFRADIWQKDIKSDLGKAVRIQLFKGNDYRFCVAVPPDSGVHVTATVLDFEGKPVGKIQPVAQGWGLILSFKPKKTGLYVLAIRETEDGKAKEVPCAVITGWK